MNSQSNDLEGDTNMNSQSNDLEGDTTTVGSGVATWQLQPGKSDN